MQSHLPRQNMQIICVPLRFVPQRSTQISESCTHCLLEIARWTFHSTHAAVTHMCARMGVCAMLEM